MNVERFKLCSATSRTLPSVCVWLFVCAFVRVHAHVHACAHVVRLCWRLRVRVRMCLGMAHELRVL